MSTNEDAPYMYTWWQNFVYAWWLLKENIAVRGHRNIHRVWYWTFVYLKYMFGIKHEGRDIE